MTPLILPPDLDSLSREDMKSLILALYEQVQVLMARVAELEAQLGGPPKNSDNSSLPPSKDFKANTPKGGKDGKNRRDPAEAVLDERAKTGPWQLIPTRSYV